MVQRSELLNGGRRRTFSSHADLEAFLEPTVLALVAVVLVDGAVATAATRVGEVAADRALEEALAALARQHAVVLPRTLVAAHDALGVQLQPVPAAAVVAAAVARRIGDGSDVSVLLRVRVVVRRAGGVERVWAR